MKIDAKTAADIGVALNEATFLGAEYDPDRNLFGTTFSVLTLAEDDSPGPSDPRRQIVFSDVGRISAALRDSSWEVLSAETVPFGVSDMLSIVQSFGGLPIYSWESINNDDPALEQWEGRLSLDIAPPNGSLDNRINLFQEAVYRHLDLWVWFDEIHIRDASGNEVMLSDFIAGGKRWWDAFSAGELEAGSD